MMHRMNLGRKKRVVYCILLTLIAINCFGCSVDFTVPDLNPSSTATRSESEILEAVIPDKTLTFPNPLPTAVSLTPSSIVDGEEDPLVEKELQLQEALYQASLDYLAATPEAADAVARKIAYVDGINESASNSCGPLSIAILKAAGFLPATTSVHDIWLLNLREEKSVTNILYREYFPPQEYEYIWVDESTRAYDFTQQPLEPGDWLFLFTAGNGFDHMLTVTRVDEDGAAYSVTNVDRGKGFIISEEKLYDPQNEGEGLFFELTDPEARRLLGLTGTAGWLLVRRIGGIAAIPALGKKLDIGLTDQVNWHILIKDISQGEVLFESLPNELFHPASMIKIPLAIAALQILEEMGYNIADFTNMGYEGRTFDQLFSAMVVVSEELASEQLLDFVRENSNEVDAIRDLGLIDTRFEPRSTTAFDLGIVLEGLYTQQYLSEGFNSYLLDLMSVQTENDSQYLGAVKQNFPQIVLYNKRGLLLSPTIVSDMGIMNVDGEVYTIIVSGTPKKGMSVTYEDIEEALEDFANRFVQYALSE